MAKPASRQELVDYCLRNLGAPVITINVDEDQLDDRVDEALQFYQEYHSDAVLPAYRKHTITATDIANEYIELPENVLYLTRMLAGGSNTQNMFSIEYQMHLNDVYDLRAPSSIINYEMSRQYQELLHQTFDERYAQQIRFQRKMNRVYIDSRWGTDIREGEIIVFEVYTTLNPDDYVKVYDDLFLKRYLTALIKRQWGANTKKFTGMQLPGGVEINGQQIFDEAQEEIRQIEEEMDLKYVIPPVGFIG